MQHNLVLVLLQRRARMSEFDGCKNGPTERPTKAIQSLIEARS